MGEDGPREVPGDWVTIAEAARRLRVSRRAIRNRIERGTLTARPTNKGRDVFVPDDAVPGDGTRDVPGSAQGPVGTSALELGEVERLREALAEAEDEAAEARVTAARMEGENTGLRGTIAELRQSLDDVRAERARLATALDEARRPLLLRLVEALRGYGRRGG
jgi:chromosome segregation ATPase